MKLSVIIPVYNEEATLLKILKKIQKIKINKEVIIVNDGSNDNTKSILNNLKKKYFSKIIHHNINCGKGSAIITAKKYVTGDIVIIQDADLEYDPNDYKKLIKPILKKNFKVVYGSRVLGRKRYKKVKSFISISRVFFNHSLTTLSNIINNQNLTDAHTCYKVFSKDVFFKLKLKEKGFAFCPEVNSRVSKLNLKIKEVKISYKGRTQEEGKKIGTIDGVEAILALLKYGFLGMN